MNVAVLAKIESLYAIRYTFTHSNSSFYTLLTLTVLFTNFFIPIHGVQYNLELVKSYHLIISIQLLFLHKLLFHILYMYSP